MSSRGTIEVRLDTAATKEPGNATDILKFGITTPLREGDKGELVFLRPEQPLLDAVAQVCQTWGFSDPSIFALKFNDVPGHYVTEATRKELSGKLVSMQHSPLRVSQEIIDKLKSPSAMEAGLKELSEKASDPTLVDVFVSQVDGLNVILELIEKDKLVEKERAFSYALQSIIDIMLNSSSCTWDKLEPPVISKIIAYVNSPKGAPQDRLALRTALQVLENSVSSGQSFSQVEKEITLPNLMMHIQNPSERVQQNAMSFINAVLSKSDQSKRKHLATLSSRKYRDIIIQHVIKRPGDPRPAETSHQLYVMQTIFLNSLDDRRQTPVDSQDQDSLNKIKDLCKIAFDSDGSFGGGSNIDLNSGTGTMKREKPNFSRDYKKLGFQNDINPAQDFTVVPPGVLALDCMHFLANTHTDIYNKLVLETSCRGSGDECPFARACITLTNVLCEILRIGEPPNDQQVKFYPFFFQHEKPFEELFCICAQVMTKTWKEMRATSEDFDKVFDVVRDQITRGLEACPETLKFQDLRIALNTFTYAEIQVLRAQERFNREEGELQAKPIQELRRKLEPEMRELIKENRLNFLVSGTRFNKYSSKGLLLSKIKEGFWFCRLSPNGKVLHFGDCVEKATPTPEELPSKINVADLQDLLIGKDCPHIKDKRKNVGVAFSLVTERDPIRSTDFIAPDEKTFNLWTDGINALLGKPMTSKEALSDLDILLNMEIKLRLLDIEGIPEIPQEAPPIPELPTNFDFSTFLNMK